MFVLTLRRPEYALTYLTCLRAEFCFLSLDCLVEFFFVVKYVGAVKKLSILKILF